MNPAERLQNLEEWVAWVRDELGHEVGEVVALVATQPFGVSIAATTSAAIVGRQQISERVEPLLDVLDQIAERLRYEQHSLGGVS